MSTKVTDIIKDNWKKILGIGLLCGFFSVLISLVFPLEYRSNSQVLVTVESSQNVDAYTAARSAEKVGENIVNIIGTGDFFAKALSQIEENEQVDKTRFENLPEKERREEWQQAVEATLDYNSNMITLNTYSTNQKQANILNQVVLNTLINNANEYTGSKVSLRVVNPPLVSNYPVRPNLFTNFLVAFFAGGVLITLILLRKKNSSLFNLI